MAANKNSTVHGNTDDRLNLPPPYSLPFTTALLISESFFSDERSPASTLIIPLIRVAIPYAYFIIITLDLMTALLVKWSYGPAYSILAAGNNTALPDSSALRQIYSLSSSQANRRSQTTQLEEEATPIFPIGMAFNISFSSPFSEPNSKSAALYTLEFLQIRNVPGFLLPLASLVLYFVLLPLFKARSRQNNKTSDKKS